MSYWLAPYYVLLASLDVVAACIACYVVFRVGKLYARIKASWLSFLVAGYALLAIALVASAVSYGMAASKEFWHNPGTRPHGPSWRHELTGWSYGIPPHWAYGAGGRGVSPFWAGIEALLLISYVLILASVVTGRVEVKGSEAPGVSGVALGLLGFGVAFGLGLNVVSATILLVAAVLVISSGRGVPSAGAGYLLLAVSHILEVLAIQYLSADLMLIAEGLRPAALLVIGVGVGVRGRHG